MYYGLILWQNKTLPNDFKPTLVNDFFIVLRIKLFFKYYNISFLSKIKITQRYSTKRLLKRDECPTKESMPR